MSTAADAPGKVVLCGEYAVLDGAPAVAMAVDRRARVRIVSQPGSVHTVRAPGLRSGSFRFKSDESGLVWVDGDPLPMLEAVWTVTRPAMTTALDITLDTTEFRQSAGSEKLGLGSSAALTAALVLALCPNAKRAPGLAYRAHETFQQGHGSGVDIASSLHGGVIEYRMPDRRAESLRWPDELRYTLLFSGTASSTRSKLKQLAAALPRRSRTQLAKQAAVVANSWRSNDVTQLIADLEAYIEVLEQFSDDHRLGIFDCGHAALVRLARQSDVLYKPCGAGGGDIGIAIGLDPEALQRFVRHAEEKGFTALDIGRDDGGARRQDDQHD